MPARPQGGASLGNGEAGVTLPGGGAGHALPHMWGGAQGRGGAEALAVRVGGADALELEAAGGPPQGKDTRGQAECDSDALDSELELEPLEAVTWRVAKCGCLGGSVGRGVADGVDAESFVGGDGAGVDVRLDLVDGGNKVALLGACRRSGRVLRVA